MKIAQSDLDFILLQLRLPNNQPVLPVDMTGIRDVQGVGNNIANPSWGTASSPFSRLFAPDFNNYTPNTFAWNQFGNPGSVSNYAIRDINLQDSSPRTISNLVSSSHSSTLPTDPEALRVFLLDDPSTTPGGRLSPLTGFVNPLPYSGYLSLMGQFFDHGLDFVQKGADGDIVIKLQPGDPLYVQGSPNNFMVAPRTNTVHVDIGTESTNTLISALGLLEQRYTQHNSTLSSTTVDVNGVVRDATYVQGSTTLTPQSSVPAGVIKLNNVAITIGAGSTVADVVLAINAQTAYTGVSASINNDKLQLTYLNGETINRISPFIDLSQQYGSIASQTAFIREYSNTGEITGSLVGNAQTGSALKGGSGIATWADIKANALKVGVVLHDIDVLNIPEVRLTSTGAPYLGTGNQAGMWLVARDKTTGDIYYVKDSDIASNATFGEVLDANGVRVNNPQNILSNLKLQVTNHAFLDDIAHNVKFNLVNAQGDFVNAGNTAESYALLNAHYVAGDGRTNENIGLTSIHDIFHSEHELVLQSLITLNAERIANDVTYIPMTGEELFQAAKLVVEMEYQHMIFGEFARRLSPNIGAFAAYDPTENPAISQEFANAVYRLGHSMLTDYVDTSVLVNGLKTTTNHELFDVFLNPAAYQALNDSGVTNGGVGAAGQIAMGMSAQVGAGIDQWVTDTLRNKLVGLPLDLAALNIARGRDTGMPTFEEARDAVYAQTGMTQFARHNTWYDFAENLMHPETVVDFVAAYADFTGYNFTGSRIEMAQQAIQNESFMNSNQDFRKVDLWLGGLAEAKETNSMLGTLFDFVFATQMVRLQNNDRFYYLGRLVGTELLAQIESQLLVDIVERNTGAKHMYKDIFSVADSYVEMSTYNKNAPTHSIISAASDAGYAANGIFYGDRGEYLDARGVASPNGKGNSSEMIGGTSGNDIIHSLGGNDTVYGDGGNDTIDGGNGNDFLLGGEGNDLVQDFGGDDFLWGDAGNDTVDGGAGLDQIFGGTGNDNLYGSDGDDIVEGGADHDLMFGDFGRPTPIAGQVAQYMHYVRPVGGGTPTFTISTSATPLNANDTVILLNGNMDSLGGADILGGGDGNDVIFGGGGTDALDGADGNDTLIGGAGADAYLGGLGDDFFLSDANDYAFNNTMDGSEGFDTVSYQLSVRAVSISLGNPGVAIIPPGTNVLDTFLNMEGLIGSRFNDVLQGSDVNNVIEGLEGNDTIEGGLGGGDMVSYASVAGARGVTVNLAVALQNNSAAGVGTDTLLNIEGAIGTKNIDTLTGNAFDNIFEGLAGNDVISGGAGNDTASYKSALQAVRISLGNQAQTGNNAEVGNDTLVSIENVIGGMGNDTLTGSGAANVIDGGPGGNDTLDGGAGTDTVSYEHARNSVIVNLNTTSTILGVNYTTQAAVGSGIDRLISFENVTGSMFNDSLIGNTAANVLTGGLGDDSLAGGAGNDMYVIRDAAEHGAAEIINDTAGTDEIRFTQVIPGATLPAMTLTLSDRVSGVERVNIASGLGAITYSATGVVTGSLDITTLNVDASAMTNGPLVIVGNSGANILAGTHSLLGDTLVGGTGNDTYVVSNANDVVLEGTVLATEIDQVNVDFTANGTYILGNNIENGSIVTADTSILVNLTGNALANNLLGNAGDNVLDGGLGDDNMAGGLGDDTYVVNALTDVVVENLDEGNDTIRSSITYSLLPTLQAATGTYSGSSDVENLTLTGTAAINGTGNDLDNVITGNTGNNTLNGGAGADTLIGGLGNDTYQVDALDVIVELAGEGSDTISTSVTYTLSVGSNIENLTLTGGNNINGTGDAGNNLITGNTGANTLDGGGGIDTLVGGAGNDTYIIDDIFDTITELTGGGTDTVRASLASYTLGANIENLVLTGVLNSNGLGNTAANRIDGNSGNNSILGDAGNDTLVGGLGADTMQGGTGADRFVLTTSADSILGARDVIMDFLRGGTTADKIDLSAIDANQVTGGDQAFSATLRANSSANFTAIAQLRYWNDGTNTYVEGNTDNEFATAEFSIQLVGVYGTMSANANLAQSDFVL